jgi:hypothetical protein
MLESLPLRNDTEIIVVDNASFADEASIIEQRFPSVTVVRSKENLGFAGGNNLGIQASHGEYLFFLNNDTLLGADFDFSILIHRLETQPSIGAVCPKIRFSWNNKPIQFAGYTPLSSITIRNSAIGCGEEDCGQHDSPHPTPYAHGAAMMVKREAVEKAGLMPECFFLYYEELDWSMMIRRAGYEIWYEPLCTVYHKESQTTGSNSPLRTYYIARNRLLFARRNIAPPKRYLSYSYIILIAYTKDILKHLCKRQPQQAKAVASGVIDFLKAKYGKKL